MSESELQALSANFQNALTNQLLSESGLPGGYGNPEVPLMWPGQIGGTPGEEYLGGVAGYPAVDPRNLMARTTSADSVGRGNRGRRRGGRAYPSQRTIGPTAGLSGGESFTAGVMFGCTSQTFEECVSSRLFGLPRQYLPMVQSILPGRSVLFLFNFSDRMLHGVFEAVAAGGENLDANAWTKSALTPAFAAPTQVTPTTPPGGNSNLNANGIRKNKRSPFPAQVRVEYVHEFSPMPENFWRHVLGDGNRIQKLTRQQSKELIDCFAMYESQLAYWAAHKCKRKFNM
eukprot:CAMPEP_0196663480 /NCGR_PEP_ID=MMETSP1086-20130531/53074_1 /TAXON_ID=77921 /ORGANISM="Cyanoptyche  gloeocystis , Strain SAG4.97" /LENGTH=286 /DNA_ID=CAMNT_0041999319 /DNA_START=50 /DNA_END=910 /DNA_ORIENTATION=-